MGIDQKTFMVGPTSLSSGADYFLNVSRLSATVRGYVGPPLVSNASLGDANLPVNPSQYLFNPINTTVVQSGLNLKVTVLPITGNRGRSMYVAHTSYFPTQTTCPADDFGGYISLLGGSKVLPPISTTYVSVVTDNSIECGYSLPIAACCGLYYKAFDNIDRVALNITPSFLVNAEGSFNVLIDKFNITQYYKSRDLSFACFPPSWAEATCTSPTFVYDFCGRPSKGLTCPSAIYDEATQHWVPTYHPASGNVTWAEVNGTWLTNGNA